MIVIGITGTLGAGKGTIVEYLSSEKGFAHFSVRGFLLELIRQQGMPENRDSMFHLANELRAAYGPSYVVDQLYEQARQSRQNSIIESIRTTGEIDSLKSKGRFYLIAVDADPAIRYQRILLRQSETDAVSFETFLANEQRESVSEDPGIQNLPACIQRADFLLLNDGSIPELENNIDLLLAKIL